MSQASVISGRADFFLIVPTLRVVTQELTLCVNVDAERLGRHSHAERWNDPGFQSSANVGATGVALLHQE